MDNVFQNGNEPEFERELSPVELFWGAVAAAAFLLMFVSLETLLLSGAYVIYLVSRHLGYSPSSPSFESDLTSELPLAVIAGVLF